MRLAIFSLTIKFNFLYGNMGLACIQCVNNMVDNEVTSVEETILRAAYNTKQ